MTDTQTEPDGEGVWTRLRRRKVVQWGIAYLAGAWGLLQGIGFVADAFHWPDAAKQVATLVLLIGLPIVLVVAWYHGDRGEQRVTRVELAIVTLLFLVGGGIFWLYDRAGETPTAASDTTAQASAPTATSPVATALPPEKSIAVLPFVDMSAAKDQEYMSDGMAEELLNLLAKVPELKVIARTSSFAFKGEKIEIAEIAKRLNVAHVLEGSVRTSGKKIRITAQLIRAADSTHLWSETFDRPLDDIFAVQDEIAVAVVSELKTKLLAGAHSVKATDPKAYALFLQARDFGRQYSEAGFKQSNSLYQGALALDPQYAPAWEGLAGNYCNEAFSGLRPIETAMQLAREATSKALTLEPDLARAHARLGWIASYYDLDLAAAARHFAHAIALEPANPDILSEAGFLLRRLGRLDQAIEVGRYQISLDPMNPYGHETLAYSYRFAGHLDDAITELQTVLKLSPNYVSGHVGIGELLLQKGEPIAALAETKREVLPGLRLAALSMVYHALGQAAQSNAALEELIQKYETNYAFDIARVYAFRREPDRAFVWLEKAAGYHDLYLSAVAVHPTFTNIYSDPRWLPFLRTHGLAPEQLAAIKFDVTLPK